MRSKREILYGLYLMGILLVATLWLALHNKLQLYIHPRYQHFTLVMAIVGLLAISLCLYLLRAQSTGTTQSPSDWRQQSSGILVGICCLGLALLPAAVLSSNTASQRGLNSTAIDTLSIKPPQTTDTSDFRQFSIKEWASLLATTEARFFAGKPASVQGFVYAGDQYNKDVMYVARFQITCCAVDAQPKGVPVYVPDWRSRYQVDQWVAVEGTFVLRDGAQRAVIEPNQIKPITQPKDPYDY